MMFMYDSRIPEHLDARTTISRDMFYYISDLKKKTKIKTSLPTVKFLKKDANQFFFYLALGLVLFKYKFVSSLFLPARACRHVRMRRVAANY